MGFLSSFFSGNPNVTVTGDDAAMAIATGAEIGPQNEYGIAEVPGTSTWGSTLGAALGNYTTVRGNDGKINVPLTVLDNARQGCLSGLWDCQGWHGRNRRDLWPHHNDSRRSCRRARELHCVSRGQPKPVYSTVPVVSGTTRPGSAASIVWPHSHIRRITRSGSPPWSLPVHTTNIWT
jgi:hypothetical protein